MTYPFLCLCRVIAIATMEVITGPLRSVMSCKILDANKSPENFLNFAAMLSIAGYEHDTNEIDKDKCDPNDADCSLWDEL
jgi:hypothetical protein